MLSLNRLRIYNWFDAGPLPSVPDTTPRCSGLNRLVDDGYVSHRRSPRTKRDALRTTLCLHAIGGLPAQLNGPRRLLVSSRSGTPHPGPGVR